MSFLSNATKFGLARDDQRSALLLSQNDEKRIVVVLTDGESLPVAAARLGTPIGGHRLSRPCSSTSGGSDERVFSRGVPEPQYLPDPSSRSILDGLAASTGGSVHSEASFAGIERTSRELLDSGPTVVQGSRSGRTALAPFLAAAAFLPLSILLWRRDR